MNYAVILLVNTEKQTILVTFNRPWIYRVSNSRFSSIRVSHFENV